MLLSGSSLESGIVACELEVQWEVNKAESEQRMNKERTNSLSLGV